MKKVTTWVIVFSCIAGICLWGYYTQWRFFSPYATTTSTTTTPTDVVMTVVDTDGIELEDAVISVYQKDVSALSASQINALTTGSFSLKNTYDSGEDFSFDGDYIYYAKTTLTNFLDAYALLAPGANVIVMTRQATTVQMLGFSSPALNTTVANATETDWTIVIHMLDSEGEVNSSVGYNPSCDFSKAIDYEHWGINNQYLVMNVTFYTTPTVDSVTIDGYTSSTAVSSNSVLLRLSAGIMGSAELSLTFASNVATLQPKSLSLRWGNTSVNTELAVQV